MIRLLIPIILVILLIILARRYIFSAPIDQQKSRKVTVLLVALTLGLLILTLFHRMHWLAATVPAVILAGRKLLESLSTVFKTEKNTDSSTEKGPSQNKQSSTQKTSSNINEEEALQVLGLQRPYNKEDVIEAHRKLIQKFHPDRGGNDYLATKINEAKDFLLQRF